MAVDYSDSGEVIRIIIGTLVKSVDTEGKM